MMLVFEIVFWTSAAAILHSYGFYPLLVKWLARHRLPNRMVHRPDWGAEWPHLVVVMAVHDEEEVLEKTLQSIFAADYPAERFSVLIGSDNSTDRTNEILARFRELHSNLEFQCFDGRNGKIRILNRLVNRHRARLTRDTGDFVMILCDANVTWSRELPRLLARHFRNPKIGQVSPNVLDSRSEHVGIAGEEEAYINRENRIKYHEGLLWGRMMGAFGACYAMRGRLFEAIPEHFNTDDFYQTVRCFELGYDAVVEPEAVCYEAVSEDIREEFRRKKRISIGNFQNLTRFWKFLFLPWRCGPATAFAFWSHKGIRWFGPFLLLAAFLTNAVLMPHHWIYLLTFGGLMSTLAAAAIDGVLHFTTDIHIRSFRFVRYFYLMNLALLFGAIRFFGGVKTSVWEPTRRVVASR